VLVVSTTVSGRGQAPPLPQNASQPHTAAVPIAPAGFAVRARLQPQQITVGDHVRVELEVTVPAGGAWAAPRLAEQAKQWGGAEVLASKPAEALAGVASRYRLALEVTAFRPGPAQLPPIGIAVPSARAGAPGALLATPPLRFEVKSVLPPKGQPTPMPPAPPLALPLGNAFWWLAGALAAACALLAFLVARSRRLLARPVAVQPALPPLQQFLAEIAALQREPSPERMHTALSLALRRLVGALLHFPATERTTYEIDQQLRQTRLPMPTRRRLLDILRRCDEVKFAKRPTTRAEAQERVATARELAREVERELAPPPPPIATTAGEEAA